MLKVLRIQNFALIRELHLEPSSGFNIITGETGAGKSIMLGAVGLLLGERADTGVLFNEEEKGIIEGHFLTGNYRLKELFEREDMEYDEELCIIRRELSPNGRSRAFVNDSPVKLESLKKLGERLMDIHSQHQNLALGEERFQIRVIDAYGGTEKNWKAYHDSYKKWKQMEKELHHLEQKAASLARDRDYNQFMLNELLEARLEEEELDEAESNLKILEGAEDIQNKLAETIHVLQDAEFNVLSMMRQIKASLLGLARYGKNYEQYLQRLESSFLELDDLAQSLTDEAEQVTLDPEKANELRERVDLLHRLLKKHQARDEGELIRIRDNFEALVEDSDSLDSEISTMQKALVLQKTETLSLGQALSEERKKQAPELAKAIVHHCRALGMPNASFEIRLAPQPPASSGLDQVQFLFSANKGMAPADIKQVASGGEFSRLIFTLKFILAGKTALPTIIFDEIDAGISGEIARRMAEMMKEMSANHQVISITHLPQMAAAGDRHYHVYKQDDALRTYSQIKLLNEKERVHELADMIGGLRAGEAALQAAEDLIKSMKS
jgi:DNA repair protein RecN (Recombination protein N)